MISFVINILIYGLANKNIASTVNKNSSSAFWLGLLGPLGTIICLFQYTKPSWKKILFGLGRFCFWSIGIQIFGEIGFYYSEGAKIILLWFIGFPFILRGKNMFNYSIKKQLDINKNIEPIKSGKNIIDINLKNEAITYLKKGNEEFKNGNYKTAVKYYTKSIETFTDLKEAYKNRSLALKKLNLTEKANKDYKKFLELSKKESS